MQKNFKQQINKISKIAKVETPEQLLNRYVTTVNFAIAELNSTVKLFDKMSEELQGSLDAWKQLPEE